MQDRQQRTRAQAGAPLQLPLDRERPARVDRGDPRDAPDPRRAAFEPFSGGELSPGARSRPTSRSSTGSRRTPRRRCTRRARARMGTDDMSVVDPLTMRVHGTEGLRVVDASVFPYVTNGNIYAPVMMTAEKAADLILGNTPLAAGAGRVLPPRRAPQAASSASAGRHPSALPSLRRARAVARRSRALSDSKPRPGPAPRRHALERQLAAPRGGRLRPGARRRRSARRRGVVEQVARRVQRRGPRVRFQPSAEGLVELASRSRCRPTSSSERGPSRRLQREAERLRGGLVEQQHRLADRPRRAPRAPPPIRAPLPSPCRRGTRPFRRLRGGVSW